MLFVVDDRVVVVWRQCEAVVPYELEGEWTREGTSMVVEPRFVEGLRGARVVEVG
jgi:hypothetical protein